MNILFRTGRDAATAAALFGLSIGGMRAASPGPLLERFYIGTYSGAIHQSTLNLETGTFGAISRAASTTDPSFVALTPDRSFLYAVNEGGARVVAFSINPTNGSLRLLNSQPSNGGAPAHVVVDNSGRNVLVANYNGGSVTVFPIQTDGRLGTATAHVRHPSGALAHCVTLDSSNHFAYVCDKGLNQVRCYVFDAVAGTLVTNTALITQVPAGSGPRHMTFDPSFKRAYVICELSSRIIGFDFNPTNGVLTPFQTVSTLPPAGFPGNTTAEIAVHPSGRFLYGSNRGYNTVVVYSVDPNDGTLVELQQQTTGRTPRNFAIDPTGAFCLVAGQDSNDIRLYSIDPQTGLLTDTGRKLTVSLPVCILPFVVEPPPPALTFRASANHTFELDVTNGFNALVYQVYQSPGLASGATWDLLTTGGAGQTNFVLSNLLGQEFFRVQMLTNN